MTALADREWRLIPERAHDGPTTMALEEIAAETAVEDGLRTVRVYSWEPSTLSLGYRQDPDSVDWAYCEREGIGVTRRQTGGGGIYHDRRADISYSIVTPADELPGDLMETYDLLCEPILDAFDRLGVPAAFADEERPALHQPCCYLRSIHPAHDVLAGGRKISGNAQYRRRDAVVQHGSLSFDLEHRHHLGVFAAPETTVDEFRRRVTSIRNHSDATRADAVVTLENALADWADAEEGSWRDDELERARELAAEKYATDGWTRRRAAPDRGE